MNIGRWSIRHPRIALAAWLAFVVVCVVLGAISGTKTLANGAVGESARGYAIMSRDGLWGPGRELAFIRASGAPVPGGVIRDVEQRFRALGLTPELKHSADGRSAVVSAQLTEEVPVERILAAVASAARAHPELTIEETGDVSADQARNRTVDRDLHRAELLSIPVTLFVLLFAFGALTAALVPVLLALSAVAAGLGLLGPLSQLFPVEDSAKTVVLLIGMAVGVDYALFFVVRSRAERKRGSAIGEALETTLRTSGRTVIVSGATVAIAMAGMYVVGVRTLSGIATAAIAVIACAVVGSLTVLPATLRLLGPRIDRGRIPFLPHAHTEGGSRFWSALVRRVTRRPLIAAVLSIGLLAALAYPALSLRISKPSDLALTAQSEPALKALADVRHAFPSAGETAVVATEAPAAARAQLRRQLLALRRLAVQERVANVPVDPIRTRSTSGGSAAALFLPLTGNGGNGSSRHAVKELRNRLIPATIGRIRGAETAVTGSTAEDIDFTRQIRRALPYVLAFVLALAFGLLLVAFRSLVVPLKAIALNLLSVGASYGVLALVFQHRWAEPILNFQSNGTIVSWLPLFLFVVLFGLSMDYHVFILSRVREAVDQGERTETAVRHSIALTAGVVTAAAAVMVGVFALFGTLSSLELKQAGVGLAAAVLIDATVIRGVLLPATMELLGEWNWYLPRRLHWLPRLAHEEGPLRKDLQPSVEPGR
ncbi:MAG TPA: MMPL family transporter [Gaiellaceae bacterium]|jgi:RND superfamily putative drug exporter|nr:MMPL family transporter [Gaiellaceae bacterium]